MSCRRSCILIAAAALACVQARAQPATVDLDTPFVITPTNVVRSMLDLAALRAGERLIDLGSGDGRIVIEAARRGARAHGVEIDPRLVAESRAAAERLGLAARATFAAEDLFVTDFAQADVVTMYLLPDVNARLAPRLAETLGPGARIVSHDYGLGDWPPDATIVVDAPDKPVGVAKRSTLMLWTVPARLAGRWHGEVGGAQIILELVQTWQKVAGTLHWRGREHRFADVRIDGASLALDIAPAGSTALALRLRSTDEGQLAGDLREDREAPARLRLRRMQ